MDTIKILTLLLFSIVVLSCDKEDKMEVNDTNYLIFGHFFGECIGEECVETYKLTESTLFEDSNDSYSATEDFNFYELANEKFELVKGLIDSVPNLLLDENENTIGCPDCADQGGLYILISDNDSIKSWRIDQSKSSVPKYLHNFMDEVNDKINLINN